MSSNESSEFEFEARGQLYTVDDFCEICQLTLDRIYELVDYGVLNPMGHTSAEWRFTTQAILQAQRAYRLQRDLDLNLGGIALALDLLEEIDRLRRELDLTRAQLARFISP
jgi:chaperone modulatory protein CbpM